MTPPKNSKPKALRRPVFEAPELPDDPWKAPWIRREPGPTQLADVERWKRRARQRPRRTNRTEPVPQDPPQTNAE